MAKKLSATIILNDTQDLEFVGEPSTLENYAETYKRLEREIATLTKQKNAMKAAILENTNPDEEIVLENGIKIKRTTYASIQFQMKEFQVDHPTMYERYIEDISKERVTIDYIKK